MIKVAGVIFSRVPSARIARERLQLVIHDDRVKTRRGLVGYCNGQEVVSMTVGPVGRYKIVRVDGKPTRVPL